MRVFRSRASVLASFALTWQIFALMLVPTAACCRPETASTAGSEMANCPMHHSMQEASCPMHAKVAADHDCHCPRLGCSQTEKGFMALLGPIGVLSTSTMSWAFHQTGDATVPIAPSSNSLAPTPVAPPPRA
jgi:hypothetical protein